MSGSSERRGVAEIPRHGAVEWMYLERTGPIEGKTGGVAHLADLPVNSVDTQPNSALVRSLP